MANDTRKITAARITEMPKGLFDPMPKVMVKLDGGEVEEQLFEYYPDELTFSAGEFVGLTVDEAHALKFSRDKAYLQSP